jgi:hypothetical protein
MISNKTQTPMTFKTIDQVLKTQNETISELIAITRDCVNACHVVFNKVQTNELRNEMNHLQRSPFTVTRELNSPVKRLKGSSWQDAARELYLKQNRRACKISEILKVPYASVYSFLRTIDGYPRTKRRGRWVTAK